MNAVCGVILFLGARDPHRSISRRADGITDHSNACEVAGVDCGSDLHCDKSSKGCDESRVGALIARWSYVCAE